MTEEIIQKADAEVQTAEEEPKSLEEFLSVLQEDPSVASHAAKYLLEAIEHYGTRTVVEEGEEKERYVFFDDPEGNGEHAILGNTDSLNDFVDQLRRMASKEGENDKIVWFNGPTATGKSELKRCFTNGLRGYSRTEAGRRYTIEWNSYLQDRDYRGMSYGEENYSDGEWYKSPVNINPLSLLPEGTQREVLENINENEEYPVKIKTDLDPFSTEIFNYLKREYSQKSKDKVFSNATSEKHLRVVRNLMDVGDGIGVLHAEDGGSVKERLVGSWMPEMMQEFQSRGRKNPQAFAYDGVFSQGNGGITVVEDARQHVDVIQKLMNIPEEDAVKLDKKILMDIDTVLLLISNPDLEAEISQYADEGQRDPLRALRRRMTKYSLTYLTSISLETQLLHRLLANNYDVWDETGKEALEKVRMPLEIYGCHFEPHAIEAAALYDVVSRLTKATTLGGETVPTIDKALAFERGYIEEAGRRKDLERYNIRAPEDGKAGIPVTYTVDILIDLAQENDVVLPYDVIEAMMEGFSEHPIFGDIESDHYKPRSGEIHGYIEARLEEDILEGMVGDVTVTEEEIEEYVDSIFAWENYDNGDESQEDDFDPYELRQFEIDFLGRYEVEYEKNAVPQAQVKAFRQEKVISPINSYMYEQKDDDFTVDEVDLRDVPIFGSILGENNWEDVERQYPDADLSLWESPPSGTETEELKDKTINRMVEELDYSEEGAEQASSLLVEVL